jgi:hypothetical protein
MGKSTVANGFVTTPLTDVNSLEKITWVAWYLPDGPALTAVAVGIAGGVKTFLLVP